ncbi:hypothetical protein [Mucilaginibacter sp. SP1R1]|uniref:hypothetical protein n=1 Tax=Mucilaginibacter sp. SP1R1 TaxID=2723091 RepID=UPI00161AF9B4|nr:hypothetical protein [Mucilaginibacter sp. SP1R1]MBB6148483.1 hypothetical protein [Mucilaginibacter sp. SP1R1]
MDKHHIELQAIAWRGKIIHETISLEKFIDLYIARYFCGNNEKKVKDLHLFFLGDNRTSFGGKCEVFKHIAETHDTDWYLKYKSVKKTMYQDLEDIIASRNVLAHRLLDTGDDTLANYPESMVFKKYNLKYKYEDYTEKDMNTLMSKIEGISVYLISRLFPLLL